MRFFHPHRDYPFTERHKELSRIRKIPYQSIKLKALTTFLEDEVRLLRSRPNCLENSHVLTSAKITISSMKRQMEREENGLTPAFAHLCRKLF